MSDHDECVRAHQEIEREVADLKDWAGLKQLERDEALKKVKALELQNSAKDERINALELENQLVLERHTVLINERDIANRLLSEEQKKADGLLAHLGAIRAVLILDGGEKMSPELRKALWLDHEVALDLQRVRRDLVETVRAWRHGGNDAWPKVEAALNALEKVEAARVEKGLPLETRIIEKRFHAKHKCRDCGQDYECGRKADVCTLADGEVSQCGLCWMSH